LDYLNNLAENCAHTHFDDVHPHWQEQRQVYLSKYFENKWLEIDGRTRQEDIHVSVEHARLTVLVGCTNYKIPATGGQRQCQQRCEHDMLPVVPRGTALFPETTTIDTELHSLCLLPIHHLLNWHAGGWLRPNDCCNMVGNFYCANYDSYLRKIISNGMQILEQATAQFDILSDYSSEGTCSVVVKYIASTH
jgi:hypothetical protein